jgi:hypothetical protein
MGYRELCELITGYRAEPIPWDDDYVEPFDPHEELRDMEGSLPT